MLLKLCCGKIRATYIEAINCYLGPFYDNANP